MAWYLVALSKIDAEKDPAPAIFLFLLTCGILWLAVTAARRRDEHRKARGDLSGWRSRQSRS